MMGLGQVKMQLSSRLGLAGLLIPKHQQEEEAQAEEREDNGKKRETEPARTIEPLETHLDVG